MKVLSAAVALVVLFAACEALATCNVTTTNISFGVYDVFSPTPLDSTGIISLTCDEAPPPDVVVAIGQSPNSGVFNPRQMRSATDLMDYNVYTDPARTAIWGDGTAGTSTVTQKVTKNKARLLTVYGRIPPAQDLAVGTYSDTLTVTINW